MHAFQRKAGELYRAVQGAAAHAAELDNRIAHLKVAIPDTPRATEADEQSLRELAARLADIGVALNGDSAVSSRNEPVPWSVSRRAEFVYQRLLKTRSSVPKMYEESHNVAESEFAVVLTDLQAVSRDLDALESRLESLGAPWTPGRTPDLNEE